MMKPRSNSTQPLSSQHNEQEEKDQQKDSVQTMAMSNAERQRKNRLSRDADQEKRQVTAKLTSDLDQDYGDTTPPSEQEPKPEPELELEQPAVKRFRRKPLELTQEQQDDVADWYREQECLYNKSHYKYKDSAFKASKWEAKASELGLEECQSLKIWVESMRSQIGRLSKEHRQSGARRKELTDRDKWINQKFDFLLPHIYRISKRSGVNLTDGVRAKRSTLDTTVSVASSDDCEEELVDPWEAINQSSQLQEQMQASFAGSKDDRLLERQQWGLWMTSVLRSIDDRLWNRFKRDSMNLMEKYQAESAELCKQDQKQALKQHQEMLGQHSVCSSPSNQGYLPAWQHKSQMLGQELMNPHSTVHPVNLHVQGESVMSSSLGAVPCDLVRAHSLSPETTPQASTTTCQPPADVVVIKMEPPI